MKPLPFKVLAKQLGERHTSAHLVHRVSIDSRLVRPGDLFCALPGARVDGHDFLLEAAQRGAAGALVRCDFSGDVAGLPVLRVPDVLAALQELGRQAASARASKVVAITGTVGKTTTKVFAEQLLRGHFRVAASPKSYNSQATLPLSILNADPEADILILEMAMSEPGQIAKLVSIAPPDVAVLTTIGVQHATHFEDGLAGIAKEKASIFSHPKTEVGLYHKQGFDVVEGVGTCRKLSFSLDDPAADFFLERAQVALGSFAHRHNFLAAAALANTLGVPWETLLAAASRLRPPPMRFEPVEKRGILFINDAYNANPDSMVAALQSLPAPKAGRRRIAVLGEMDALGAYSQEGHARVLEIAMQHADLVLFLGSRWGVEGAFSSRSELAARLSEVVGPGDVVLLKGARSLGLEELLSGF